MTNNNNNNNNSHYKIGEVSAMLDVPVSTLRFWENTFDQLDPFRTPGGTRRYRPEDVETCKLIRRLLRDKGYSIEYAKNKLSEFITAGSIDNTESLFPCKSTEDALHLLSELKIKFEMDAYAVARIESIEGWIKQKDSQS